VTKVSLRRIFHTWWPLAASWLFMGTELPMISAVMARLANPKIHLAAYGGVVFPIALIIEAPIIMLLAASTALSKDWVSYRKGYRFMMWAGGTLTAIHFAIAYTPLFYPVVQNLMGVPDEIVEPARLGMMIMIPWTWTIAYRRYHQGVLIRFGHSRAVGLGTAIRLASNAGMMAVVIGAGRLIGVDVPGIVVGTSGIAAGVISEAIYAGIAVRPVLRREMPQTPTVSPPLTWPAFFDFYWPLAVTALLNLIVQPMGSAAVSRMPLALDSLAVWPVVGGLTFMLRSMGFAYNEVVVALLDEPGALRNLRQFTGLLFAGVTAAIVVVAATRLSFLWFHTVSGLDAGLTALARNGLWAAALWPGLSVLQNWFQGVIVNQRKTRVITESVIVFMGVTGAVLVWGAATAAFVGLYVGLAAFVIGQAAQVGWLWWRSRPLFAALQARDTALLTAPSPSCAAD